MSRLLWIEFRRSPLWWGWPLLVAVDLAVLFGRGRYWIGVWPQASAAVQLPSAFLGAGLAGAAAFAAGRTVRHGLAERLAVAAKPVWRAELAQLLGGTVSYGVLAYLVGAGAAAAVSLSEAGPGFLWPGYLVLGLAAIVSSCGVGHLLGRWFRSELLAPVVASLGTGVLLTAFDRSSSAAFTVLVQGPQWQVGATAIGARVAFAAAVVAVAVTVPGTGRRGGPQGRVTRSALLPAMTSLAAASVALVALGMAGPVLVTRQAPRTPLCTAGLPRVCLWPEDRKYLPAIEAMMARSRALPQPLIVPQAYYEFGLRPPQDSNLDFEIIEGSIWSVSPGIVGSILQVTVPYTCAAATDEAERRRQQATFELGAWLEARLNGTGQPPEVHGGPPVDLAAVGSLIHKPEREQTAWARQRISLIRATRCA